MQRICTSTLLDQLFNKPPTDRSGRARNKYRAPGLQSRKRFIWVGRGSGATSAPRPC